jgi:hypothetical protein
VGLYQTVSICYKMLQFESKYEFKNQVVKLNQNQMAL